MQELYSCFIPIYCPATTAPPVASAVNMFIISMFTVSTSDIADTADSPTLATIIESIRPTAIVKNCSITSGTISFFKSILLNK